MIVESMGMLNRQAPDPATMSSPEGRLSFAVPCSGSKRVSIPTPARDVIRGNGLREAGGLGRRKPASAQGGSAARSKEKTEPDIGPADVLNSTMEAAQLKGAGALGYRLHMSAPVKSQNDREPKQ